MRGSDERTGSLFSYVGIEGRLRPNHPKARRPRSFGYVDDLAGGFRKLMDSPDAITGSKSQLARALAGRRPQAAPARHHRRRDVLGAHLSPQGSTRRTIDQFGKLLAEG